MSEPLQPLSKEERVRLCAEIEGSKRAFWQKKNLQRSIAIIDQMEQKLKEVYDAINVDGDIKEHEDFVALARDGAHALGHLAEIEQLESRQKKLVEALNRSIKALRFVDTPEGRMVYYSELADQLTEVLREIGEQE